MAHKKFNSTPEKKSSITVSLIDGKSTTIQRDDEDEFQIDENGEIEHIASFHFG